MKSNQKGFSVVEILIVLVVVGLLGTAGWLVYDRQNNKIEDKTVTQTTQQDQATNKNETTPQTTTQPSANEGFYEIKEWGIKIALRDYDKVQFDVKNQSGQIFGSDHYDGYADPSFKSAFLQDKTCDPGVALYRSKVKFASGSDDAQKKVGDYYYIVTGGPGACSNDPENNPDDQLKARFLKDVSDPNNIFTL